MLIIESEQEIIEQLEKAEVNFKETKLALAKARSLVMETETSTIEAKLYRDSLKEKLRVHRNTVPRVELTRRDLEIQKFREEWPDLVEWAKERDLSK